MRTAVLSFDELIVRFGPGKRNGKRVVFTNGCFDLLHPGHIRSLETARGLGVNPFDPAQALQAAARLDAGHLRQFATQAKLLAAHYGGNRLRYQYGLALAASNAGPGATTRAWQRAYGAGWPAQGAWVWLERLPAVTQRYVPGILGCAR